MNTLTEPICLTDPPEIVELKREFRALDEQEEALKSEARLNPSTAIAAERSRVRERKESIAAKIFLPGRMG